MEKLITPKTTQKIHGDTLIIFFKDYILSHLSSVKNVVIIEVGSERGAGSTFKLSNLSNSWGCKFITIDAAEIRTNDALKIVKKVNPSFEAIHALGEKYIESYDQNNIGLCYLDAFDLVVEDYTLDGDFIKTYTERSVDLTNEAAYKMHYDACVALKNKIIKGGFICFDDVWLDENNIWQGKGKTAIPYILSNGFTLIAYKKTSALFQKTEGYSDEEIKRILEASKSVNLDMKIFIRRLKRIPFNILQVIKEFGRK
jgi:hypothetical protein